MPSDEIKRNAWNRSIFDGSGFMLNEKSHVCSLHFQPDSFVTDLRNRFKLKINAIPTVFKSAIDTNKLGSAENAADSNMELCHAAENVEWWNGAAGIREMSEPIDSNHSNKPLKITLKNVRSLTSENIQELTEFEAKTSLDFLINKYNTLANQKKSIQTMYGVLKTKYKSLRDIARELEATNLLNNNIKTLFKVLRNFLRLLMFFNTVNPICIIFFMLMI